MSLASSKAGSRSSATEASQDRAPDQKAKLKLVSNKSMKEVKRDTKSSQSMTSRCFQGATRDRE